MDKKVMREEAERLVREAMSQRSVKVKEGQTRFVSKCGKCGAENKVSAERGTSRASFTCKECGHKQMTL